MEKDIRKRLDVFLKLPAIRQVLHLLSKEGEETRIVGGAVRDVILGLPVFDVDLATTMRPDEVVHLAEQAGCRAIPTGIDHGTITIVLPSYYGQEIATDNRLDGKNESAANFNSFEVTTLREDIETDGRHAKVKFGRDFNRDGMRRDFTINALLLGIDGELYDYFDGIDDISQKKVRFIGDPQQRLREDYLRALRFLRFSAIYGEGKLEEQGFEAVILERNGLNQLSKERVRQEILKLLKAEYSLSILQKAEEEGLISQVLGVGIFIKRLEKLIFFYSDKYSTIFMLFILALDDLSSLDSLKNNVCLTREEVRFGKILIKAREFYKSKIILEAKDFKEYIAYFRDEFSPFSIEALQYIFIAENLKQQTYSNLLMILKFMPEFLLSGRDVLALGVKSGIEVRDILIEAKILWVKSGFPEGRDEQKRIILKSFDN